MISVKREGKYVLENQAPDFGRKYDVVVCGLGTAGSEALLRAASLGLSVLGIERLDGIGGLSTLGCVCDYYYGTDGGSFEETDKAIERLSEEGYTVCQSSSEPKIDGKTRCVSGIARCYALEKLARERGAELLFGSEITGVFLSDSRREISGIRIFGNRGFQDIKAAIFIDCTGDAALSRLSGARVTHGRDFDNMEAAFSKTMTVLDETGGEKLARGLYTFCGRMSNPDEEEYSAALLRAAAMAPCLWGEGGADKRILYLGKLPGIRENSHVVTRENLTFESALRGEICEKPVFFSFMPQDISNVDRDYAYESELLCDFMVICSMGRYGFSAAVPLGALIPEGIDNLLLAGKHIGIDHDISGGLRMQKDMKKTAEAAADIAYLAKKHGVKPVDVPYPELLELLRKTGCYDEIYNSRLSDLHERVRESRRSRVKLPQTPEEYRRALSKPHLMPEWAMPTVIKEPEVDSTSLAMWGARELRFREGEEKKSLTDALAKFAETEECWGNFAVALALALDKRACPYLHKLIKNPPRVEKGEYPLRFKALCLVGRLGYAEALGDILDIIEDNAESFTHGVPTGGYLYRRGDIINAALSFALFACVDICKANPDCVQDTRKRLEAWRKKEFSCKAGRMEEECSQRLGSIIEKL